MVLLEYVVAKNAKDSVTKYAFEKDAVEIHVDGDGKESIATKYAIALKGQ